MKLTIRKEYLLENLNIVSKAVSTHSSMPILACVLLKAGEDGVRLVGNDLEMGVETAIIEADVEEDGSVALEARVFTEICRKMPEDFVTITTDGNNITTLKSGKSEFRIIGQAGDEFPFPPIVEDGKDIGVRAAAFKDIIRQTIFSVALDDKKPVLTGELMEIKDGRLHFVTVDGYRISYRRYDDVTGVTEHERSSIIIPSKALTELMRLLPADGDETLYLRASDKHVAFRMEKYTLVSRLLEGEFIRYDQIFNEDCQTMITVNRADFLACLERATLIARDVKKTPLKFEISSEKVIITSATELGTSYDELDAETDGLGLEIAFNPRYLIDAMKAVDEDLVTLKFTGQLSPCVIKSDENEKFKYLILPLRIRY